MTTTTKRTLTLSEINAFMDISSALSPENLMWDGERSAAAANRAAKSLKARWAALETTVGRKVTEDEVLSLWLELRSYRRPVGSITRNY